MEQQIAMFYLIVIFPAAAGWYGTKRGLSFIEAMILGLLPLMIVAALQ